MLFKNFNGTRTKSLNDTELLIKSAIKILQGRAVTQNALGRLIIYSFLPARRYASAGLCDSDVSVRLSVRPSVCLSVRRAPVLCLAERKQDREMYTI